MAKKFKVRVKYRIASHIDQSRSDFLKEKKAQLRKFFKAFEDSRFGIAFIEPTEALHTWGRISADIKLLKQQLRIKR